MANYAIIGASSGIGAALGSRLSGTHQVWSLSRTAPSVAVHQHTEWDVLSGPPPADALPESLDGLVYCPGSIRLAPFERIKDVDFEADWTINLAGAVQAIRAALPALRASGAGSIVLFSTTAVRTGMPMHASVAAAKGAVEGLTRALAAEFAPKVRVNCIAPSLTDTPLAGRLLRTETQRKAAAERHPMGRVGTAEELAAAAAWLLSSESAFMSGEVLHLDGGIGALRLFK